MSTPTPFKIIGILSFAAAFHLFLCSSVYLHTSLQSQANFYSTRNPLFGDISRFPQVVPNVQSPLNPGTRPPLRDYRVRSPVTTLPRGTPTQGTFLGSSGGPQDIGALIYNDILNKVEYQIGISSTGICLGLIQMLASLAFLKDATKYHKLWIFIMLVSILISLICFSIAFNSYEEFILQINFNMFYFFAFYLNLLILTSLLLFIAFSYSQLQEPEPPTQAQKQTQTSLGLVL